ncbi:MAG: hypothetical protein ABW024_11035, partial [Microbacterium sp.]
QEVARCSPDGTCPAIAAPNGEKRTYAAVAVNAVGQSAASVQTIAWAYAAPPAPPTVRVRPGPTAHDGGVVALTVEGLDPETGSVEITSPTGELLRVAAGATSTLEVPSYRLGSNARSPISVTPYSRFDLPPGLGGSPMGATAIGWGNGIGAPLNPQLNLTSASNGDGSSTITARATAQLNGQDSTLRYGIVQDGQSCAPVAGGATASFVLPDGEEYRFNVCVGSYWNEQSFGTSSATATVRATQSERAPRGYTYVVDPTPNVSGQRAEWVIRNAPTSTEAIPNRNRVEFRGWPTSSFGSYPDIDARYVHTVWGTPTPWADVAPSGSGMPYQVQANWAITSCVGGSPLGTTWDSSEDPGNARATVNFDPTNVRYYDASNALLAHEPGTWTVPTGAVRVEGVTVTVGWAGGYGLSPASATLSPFTCNPNNPPPPAPENPTP